MITLVSYPRSGNTFLRNVLYNVYDIPSATYLLGAHGPDADWERAPVVKTHHLPHELPASLLQRTVVLLIRDGRDAAVSFAHHRKDVVAPESSVEQNMWEVVRAAEGSHFGGWSAHVEAWWPRANAVIWFEDLIRDPLKAVQGLSKWLELSAPRLERMPTFNSQKQGGAEYGSGKNLDRGALHERWFRRGEVNAWRDEMPEELQTLYWHLHGETMSWMGYRNDGEAPCHPELPHMPATTVRVFLEASKLKEPGMDGIKRYVLELVMASQRWPVPEVDFKLLIDGNILNASMLHLAERRQSQDPGWFNRLKKLARALFPESVYGQLARTFPKHRMIRWRHARSVAASRDSVDVIHLTLPQHFHAIRSWKKPTVVTVHDLTHEHYPEYHDRHNVALTSSGMQWIRANRPLILSVSESTRRDLEATGLPSQVVLEGVNRRRFYPEFNQDWLEFIRARYRLPKGKFFLSVSTLEPRKNLSSLLKAYAMLSDEMRQEHPLVLVGKVGWKWDAPDLTDRIRSSVHLIGFVPDEHLPAVYNLAWAFCYVSHYEGFGLPVLESLACGVPVIVSDNSSLPEVAGDAGLLCDPSDVDSIFKAMQAMCVEARREELRMRCLEQSWKFSWRQAWIRYVNHYRVLALSTRAVE